MTNGERKISEALLEFAEPILRGAPADPDPKKLTSILHLAMIAWNAVILDLHGQPSDYLEQARSGIRSMLRGKAQKQALAMLDELEHRKRNESPMDTRLIGECECRIDERGELIVRVSCSAPQTASSIEKRASNLRLVRPSGENVLEEFFAAAADFFRLAPWDWMQNADVFGIKDPATGTVNWCSVMGAGGEMFGMALYLGPEGFDAIRRMESDDSMEDEAMFGQPALVLAFLDREDLAKDQLALIRLSGVKFRGRGAYPQIESHGINRLPRPPSDAELRTMTHALEQALAIGSLAMADHELLPADKDGRLLLRTPVASRDGAWINGRIDPPPPIERPIPEFDHKRVKRLREEMKLIQLEVECDLFPTFAVIQEPGKDAYAPPVFMAALSSSGQIAHLELGGAVDRDEFAQRQFLELLNTLKARPSTVYVKRPSLLRVLEPICRMLEVRLEAVSHLNALDAARASLDQFARRGRSRP